MRSDKYHTTEQETHSRTAKRTADEEARAKEAKAKKEQKKARREKWNKFTRILSIIYVVFVVLFIWLISWLDVLPGKYYWPMVIILGFITLITVPAMFSKRGKMGRKIFATFLSFVLITGFAIGSYDMAKTMWLLNDITEVPDPTDDYHIVAHSSWSVFDGFGEEEVEEPSKQSQFLSFLFDKNKGEEEPEPEKALFENVSEFDFITVDKIATYLTTDRSYSEAKAVLAKELNCEYTYENDLATLVKKFKSGDLDYIFLTSANYESFQAEDEDFANEAFMLYTVKLPIEAKDVTKQVDVTKEAFNIFISGSDFQGNFTDNLKVRTDVNMVVTVNPVTHEVLVTSLPRDYHIMLHSKQQTDKLTHSSLMGIEETVATVEDTLGVDINYYLRVNFTTLIKFVDAIGGVDVESDYDFYTSGMGKDMRYLNNLHFVKGKNHLNGNEALAFCRERHSFSNGDMQRNKNQQKVIEAIIKKATSSKTILTSYTKILDALKGKMVTNMSTDEMTTIVKAQINDMPSWDIKKQNIEGKIGFGYCYSLGFDASVVFMDPIKDVQACEEIYNTMLIEKKEDPSAATETSTN